MKLSEQVIRQHIDIAYERLDKAYIPYSHFPVSAVLLLADGSVFTGINIENVSYGATVCAERVAILSAVNAGYRKRDFVAIFVIGRTVDVITPCSICRQVFVEFFDPKMPVYLANEEKEYTMHTVEALVPYSFTSLNM